MNRNNRPLRLLATVLAALALLAAAAALILAGRTLLREQRRKAERAEETAQHRREPRGEEDDEPDLTVRIEPDEPDPEPDTPDADPAVQAALEQFLSAQGGTWDIYYESLSDGAFAAVQSNHGAEPRSVAASVIKLFVMGAVYDAVRTGALQHDAVYADLRSMITASDNDACNRLVRLLGGGDPAAGEAAVNRFAQSLGCADVQMNRLMLQNNGTENYVSARDCAAILRLIYEGACVSKSASAEMLELLKGQTVNDRLPAALPQGVTVAHKTGNLSNLSCGDVGIVFSPAGDYILCLLSNYSQNDAQTTGAMATLSRTIYDIVTA